jgi:hypothetical protein
VDVVRAAYVDAFRLSVVLDLLQGGLRKIALSLVEDQAGLRLGELLELNRFCFFIHWSQAGFLDSGVL